MNPDPPTKISFRRLLVRLGWVILITGLPALGMTFLWFERRGAHHAFTVQCLSNLKQIYCVATVWSEKSGGGYWPPGNAAAPNAAAALNEMLKGEAGEGISPQLFVCPDGDEIPAQLDQLGRFQLTPANLSYAWIAAPMRNTTHSKPLAACRHVHTAGHRGDGSRSTFQGINVLWSDGSVSTEPLESVDPVTRLPAGLMR